MTVKTKFIVFDGMDNCGKSTLINTLTKVYPWVHEIKFPKTLPSGSLLRINTEKDFELLFSTFDLLTDHDTYLLDRFVVSNLVYDKVLRGEDTGISKFYHAEFLRRFHVLEIFLTRPYITSNFVDDRIKLSREQFNTGLYEYLQYGENYQLLNRDGDDKPCGVNEDIHSIIKTRCHEFIDTPSHLLQDHQGGKNAMRLYFSRYGKEASSLEEAEAFVKRVFTTSTTQLL